MPEGVKYPIPKPADWGNDREIRRLYEDMLESYPLRVQQQGDTMATRALIQKDIPFK